MMIILAIYVTEKIIVMAGKLDIVATYVNGTEEVGIVMTATQWIYKRGARMTVKEAKEYIITTLNNTIKNIGEAREDEAYLLNIAKNVAIEALDKQIPEKPYDTQTKISYLRNFNNACPVCNLWFGYNKNNNYCPRCGQAIDWSEE